ncbi:17078_t:CDS:2, partial [Racocetra fulgida]
GLLRETLEDLLREALEGLLCKTLEGLLHETLEDSSCKTLKDSLRKMLEGLLRKMLEDRIEELEKYIKEYIKEPEIVIELPNEAGNEIDWDKTINDITNFIKLKKQKRNNKNIPQFLMENSMVS